MIILRKPKIDGLTDKEKIQQICNYLYQLIDELQISQEQPTIEDIKIQNNYLMIKHTNDSAYKNLGKIVGNNGKTPQKGVDYFTDEDKLEIIHAIVGMLSENKE